MTFPDTDGERSPLPEAPELAQSAVPPPEPSMVEAALWYHAQGFNPVPTRRGGKRPLVKWKSYQDRRVTEDEIRAWWGQWPDANIAIVTGAISGLVVLDVDGDEGRQSFSELPGIREVAKTPAVETGRGAHIYLRHPGGDIKTTRIRPGLDVKGDGGLVMEVLVVQRLGVCDTFFSIGQGSSLKVNEVSL